MADRSAQFIGQEFKRSFKVGTIDKAARTLDLAFSSDVELQRWPGMAEKLSHEPGACDLSRLNDGAPLLFNHDLDDVTGVIESARIDSDGKGRAVVRFSKNPDPEEIWQDVQDGILRNVSVGYRILEVKLTSESETLDVYTVTRWQPYEISIVSVPADTSVGVGRSGSTTPNKERIMATETVSAPAAPAAVAPHAAATVDVVAERSNVLKTERERVSAIQKAARQFDGGSQAELGEEYIATGRSADEFREALLEKLNKRNEGLRQQSTPIGMSDKEVKRYSFIRAIAAMANPSDKRMQDAAAFENECHAAALEKRGGNSHGGLIVPVDVLISQFFGSRAGTISTGNLSAPNFTGTGGNVVEKNLLTGSFIDLLRNKTTLMNLGTRLGGLVGDVDIPRKVSGSSGYWLGEDDPAQKTDFDLGLISLRPKTAGAYIDITRRMLMNATPDMDAMVRNDLIEGMALTIDYAGWYGDGLNNKPLGLKYQTGIKSLDLAGTAPTFAELVEMETQIALGNADVNSMRYVANTKFRGYAKTTAKFAGVAGTIWEPGNTVNGYACDITNQIADSEYFFGNFADLLFAMWGSLELTRDVAAKALSGGVRVIALQDVDIAARRPESFCFAHV